MKYSFLADAETEYLEAIRFYEQPPLNLGESLIHEFERTMVLIVKKPEIYRLVHPAGIRRMSLDRKDRYHAPTQTAKLLAVEKIMRLPTHYP